MDGSPIYVGAEIFDVLRPLGGFQIDGEGVFDGALDGGRNSGVPAAARARKSRGGGLETPGMSHTSRTEYNLHISK